MANPRKPKTFDRAQIEKLGQPFRVTVHQDVGGRKTPVPLPPIDNGLEPGTGFNPDSAEKLGQVLPHLGGGGLYGCQAIDDAGNVYEWEWWFDPNQIPRKATEQLAAAATTARPVAVASPVVMMSTPQGPMPVAAAAPAAMPFGGFLQGVQQQQQVAPMAALPYRGPMMPPPSSPPPADPFADPLWAEREKTLKLEYEMKMRDAMGTIEAQFTNRLRSLEGMAAAAQKPARDPEVDRELAEMRAAVAESKKAAEEANRRAEKAADDARRREEREETINLIKAVNDSTQNAIGALAQQVASVAAQANARPSGPDATTQLLITSVERQGEMYKSMLDLMGRNNENATKNQMTLSDVLLIMKSLNEQGGASTVVGKMSEGMGTMLDVFRSIMELKAQMDGGGKGNPVVDMAGQAISTVSEAVTGYLQGKRDENVAKANADAAKANAQAARDVGVANAQANAVAASRAPGPSWAAPPPTVQSPPAEPDATTLDGTEAAAEGDAASGSEEVPAVAVPGDLPVDPREKEIFGVALKHILTLRVLVAEGKVNALGIAQAIATGAARVKALKANVPIFTMYEQNMYAPVVEAILPDTPVDLRREVAEILANVSKEQLIIQQPPPAPPPSN